MATEQTPWDRLFFDSDTMVIFINLTGVTLFLVCNVDGEHGHDLPFWLVSLPLAGHKHS